MIKNKINAQPRGFAAMDTKKQHEIASKGGKAPHERRGFQAMDPEQQREIASKGGSAPHERRGLQATHTEKHHEISHEGSHAPHSEHEVRGGTHEIQGKTVKGEHHPQHHEQPKPHGFGAMDSHTQHTIASKGGHASHGGGHQKEEEPYNPDLEDFE
ncbi:MAG: KGG domain-containing protein [Candidatus Babeliales bacterium]